MLVFLFLGKNDSSEYFEEEVLYQNHMGMLTNTLHSPPLWSSADGYVGGSVGHGTSTFYNLHSKD
jgi:hypothetical protein